LNFQGEQAFQSRVCFRLSLVWVIALFWWQMFGTFVVSQVPEPRFGHSGTWHSKKQQVRSR